MLVDGHWPMAGYYAAALVATLGIALASGTQYLIIGLWRRHEGIYLSYAALCLLIAALAWGNLCLHGATDLPQAIEAMRLTIGAAIWSFLPFVMFIRAYTGGGTGWRTKLAIALLSLGFSGLNAVIPTTLFFSRIEAAAAIVLPWGERLYRITGEVSPAGWAFHLATYAFFLWAMWCAVAQYRRGETMQAVLLWLCLFVEFAALLWGDIAVDMLEVRAPYVDAFAFLPFVLLMSLTLVAQLRRRSSMLEHAHQALEFEAQTRRQAEQRLRHLAYHDSLTDLPNRASALERLAAMRGAAYDDGDGGALLLIDLDNFKTINDGLGHLVGDRLLQAIARRLREAAPPAAVLARLGGDEFVLLQPYRGAVDVAQAQARALAETLIARLAEPVDVDHRVLSVGASVGVAMFPDGEADVADLLRRADIALYRAKTAGRNAVRVFQPPMQQAVDTRLLLERGLRTALEEGDARVQFALHFQPQLSSDGRLLGAEALLRWRDPQHGMVSPEHFIPLAEETGLIHALGAWVIAEACARLKAWERDGVPFEGHLAVNVSAWQLQHPQFVPQLLAQLRRAGVAPSRLALELTETALLRDLDGALSTLRRLADAGFHLALDDFGIGYSSLSYLQRLPMDVLKIDRTFVSELTPELANPLAGFIVDVAHRLGIVTVAEGVETEAQRQALAALGCDGLQGYLICRPVDDAGFRHWLAERALSCAMP